MSRIRTWLPALLCLAAGAQDLSWRRPRGVLLFADDFNSGKLTRWTKLSLNDRYDDATRVPTAQWDKLDEVRIVPAPLAADPANRAVQFTVPRVLGTFRSELALTWEPGFQERWYGLRIFVPADWVIGESDGGDIVTQWHHIQGGPRTSDRGGFPPMSVAIRGSEWVIANNYGEIDTPKRANTTVGALQPGRWVAWVFHMRWSPAADGLVEVWKDGVKVMTRPGPNTYQTPKPHTPYWKIGIYHPEWKARNAQRFRSVTTAVTRRVIIEDDAKMGSAQASYRDVAPPPR